MRDGWVPKYPDIIKQKTLLYMYKAYYSYLPSNVQRLFTKRKIAYSMRACHGLERHSVHSTMRATSLCIKGVHVWNYLCDDLQIVNTVVTFKCKCKYLLFKKYLVVDHIS